MVTYNRPVLLRQILEAVLRYQWKFDDFLIVDNGSSFETQAILQNSSTNEKYINIRLEENIGHGAGLATGLDFLSRQVPNPDYVVFLEDDSIPERNYLNELVSRIHQTEFSMVSSAGFQVRLGKRIAVKPKGEEIVNSDFALFDGAIARFEDLKSIGFPVRDWFMMFDDFEYCYRIRKAGFKIGVFTNPYIKILHVGWGGGTSHSSLWRSYYQSRNFVHFVKLHFTFFNLIDFLVLQSKRLIGGIFIKNGLKSTKYKLLGLRAGLLQKKGKSLDLKTLKEIK